MSKKIRNNLIVLLFFFLTSLAYIYLFWKTGQLYVADDRFFHLERLEEAYQNVKQGHLFSYIATNSFSQVGQAINSFYPAFVPLLYAYIRLIVKSPILAYYLLIYLEQFLGLSIAYYAGKKILNSQKAAFIFAITLRLSTYVCYNDFSRMDVGESWALVFLPLTFCGLYLIVIKNSYYKGVTNLALGLALQTYSHILLPLITVFVLLLFYLITLYIQKDKLQILKAIIISALIYLFASLWISIPVYHMAKIGIFTTELNQLGNYKLSFAELVNYSLSNTIQRGYYNIGLVLVLTLILGIIVYRKQNYVMKSYFLLGWFFTILATNLFPWSILQNTSIATIQFPWRLLNFSIFFLSLYFSNAFYQFSNHKKRYIIMFTLLSLTLLLGAQTQFKINENAQFHMTYNSTELQRPWGVFINDVNYSKAISRNQRYAYNARFFDYIPRKSYKIISQIFDHQVKINGKNKQIGRIKSGFQNETFFVNQAVKGNSVIKLPFLIYNLHDYKLSVNDKRTPIRVNQDNSCASFKTDKSYKNLKIKISFITPISFTISKIISVITFVMLLFCSFFKVPWIKFKNSNSSR